MTLKEALRRTHNLVSAGVLLPLLRYESSHPPEVLSERLVEYAAALRWIAERYPRTVLDVGPGISSWPHLLASAGPRVTALDQIDSYWGQMLFNRHHAITRGDITRPELGPRFDAVTCISTLEHIPEHRAAVRGMMDSLAPGGVLIITCPYNEHLYCENVYAQPSASYGRNFRFIAQQYSRAELDTWLQDTGGHLLEIERWRFFTGSFWTEGERLPVPTAAATADEPHQIGCFLIQKPA